MTNSLLPCGCESLAPGTNVPEVLLERVFAPEHVPADEAAGRAARWAVRVPGAGRQLLGHLHEDDTEDFAGRGQTPGAAVDDTLRLRREVLWNA